jgi:hypothetical protein
MVAVRQRMVPCGWTGLAGDLENLGGVGEAEAMDGNGLRVLLQLIGVLSLGAVARKREPL